MGGWRRTGAPVLQHAPPGEESHRAGWILVFDGETLGELHYAGQDSPELLFQFIPQTADKGTIDYALHPESRRGCDPRIEFKNRSSGLFAPAGALVARLMDDGLVRLRDLRG